MSKNKYGVTLEYDMTVLANSEEEAIRKAQEIHSQIMKTNSYERGVWMVDE